MRGDPGVGRRMARPPPSLRVVTFRGDRVISHEDGRRDVVVLSVLRQKQAVEALRWADALME